MFEVHRWTRPPCGPVHPGFDATSRLAQGLQVRWCLCGGLGALELPPPNPAPRSQAVPREYSGVAACFGTRAIPTAVCGPDGRLWNPISSIRIRIGGKSKVKDSIAVSGVVCGKACGARQNAANTVGP